MMLQSLGESRRRDVFDAMDAIEGQYGIELRRAARSPEEADRNRALLFARLQGDPIIKRWAEVLHAHNPTHIPGIGSPRNTEPWMALAEQRTWAAAIAGQILPIRFISNNQRDQPETVSRMALAAVMLFSQTYLWSKAIFDTVKACPMPRHIVDRDILPFPFTYHSTEVSYGLQSMPGAPTQARLPDDPSTDWTVIGDCPNQGGCNISMNVSGYAADPREGALIVQSGLKYGTTFPDDFPEYSRAPLNVILSMLAFLKSPYVVIDHRPLPRQWRRHGGVAAGDAETTVAVVELRRAAREAVEAYNSESRAYQHRWWVSGHYRRQWQPSRQTHEVIWIAPYLKGPTDAPMLDKVYAVRR